MIDGMPVETREGTSVLHAALDAGIYIPHLCAHDDLHPAGACRLCVVQVEGRKETVTSCSTPACDGMVVATKTDELKKLRQLALELLLTCHPSDCTSCPKYLKCELQSLIQYLEVTDQRLRKRLNLVPPVSTNPLIQHDMQRCILCGRCVRACSELRGVNAITFVQKDGRTRVGTKNGESLAEAGCKFCGACIEVCPTGSICDQPGLVKQGISQRNALVPCSGTCPAEIDIPRYVRFVKEGNPSAAAAVVREKVPFPSVLGHICSHPCEVQCRRGEINEAVSIRELKRYAAQEDDGSWRVKSRKLPPTGKKAAIIGSGPAGLTAAYYLAKQGHEVTVFESLPHPGGMMRVGIPRYRLPWAELDKEIEEIRQAGVDIRTNTRVLSAPALLKDGYDAVLAAVGTHQGAMLPLQGAANAKGIHLNTTFLRKASLGEPVEVGEKVLILGGGNVAFDCAGVARRLGAKQVQVAFLESRNSMRSSPEEIEEALEEGTIIHPSITFDEVLTENGQVTGVKCRKVCTFSFDETGKPVIACELGSEHVLEADTLIFAVGQRPDIDGTFGLDLLRGNRIMTDETNLTTSVEGVFAAGDAVRGTASVIEAIAAGRKAAMAMDKYLGGNGDISETLAPEPETEPRIGREDGFAGKSRCSGRHLPVKDRADGFALVQLGFDGERARKESERCLQCDLRLSLRRQKFWSEYAYR